MVLNVLRNDDVRDFNHLSGETVSTIPTLGMGNGSHLQKGYPVTFTNELSQVLSQLDVDDGGEVCYIKPSSNLNFVSDVSRIAHLLHEHGRA